MRGSRLDGKNALVIGGAGMIGSTIAHKLVERGADVTVLDALLPLYGGNPHNLSRIRESVRFVHADIRDGAALRDIVGGKDLIFNLAAQVSYVRSNNEPLLDLDINCRGIINVLEACRSNAPGARVLFASSRFVYGNIEYNPVDEMHPFNCRSIYGIHKLAAEKYHRLYQDAYGLNTVSLRLSNPYGPRQQMKHSEWGILNWFVRLALDSQPLTVFGSGVQKRDYIYVDDIAEGFLVAATADHIRSSVYNLGSGMGIPFIEMANTVATMIPGTVVRQVEWPADRYFVETGDYVSNVDRFRNDTGWLPETPFDEGVRRTIEFYRQNRRHYWS